MRKITVKDNRISHNSANRDFQFRRFSLPVGRVWVMVRVRVIGNGKVDPHRANALISRSRPWTSRSSIRPKVTVDR